MSIDWRKIFEKPELNYKIEGNFLINLQDRLKELEDELMVSEIMLKKVRTENDELGKFMDDYQRDLSGLNKKLEFKSKNLAVLLEIKEDNKLEIKKLKFEKEELGKLKNNLENQFISSSENSLAMEQILESKNQEIEKLKTEIEQIKEDKREVSKKLKEDYDKNLSEKNEKLEDLKRKIERAEMEAEKINFEKESELERLKTKLERAKKEVNTVSLKSEQIRTEVQEDLNQVILVKDREIQELNRTLKLKEHKIKKELETINSLKADIQTEKKNSHILELIHDKLKIKGFISDKELEELISGFDEVK